MATMQSRLADLITAIGTDYKQFRTWITGSASGDLTGLTTTAKTSLLAAINEVNSSVAAGVADATETVKGKVELATNAEAITGTDTTRVTTPANVKAVVDNRVVAATDTASGIVELATTGEATTGTDTTRAVTAAGVKAVVDARVVAASTTVAGIAELATDAEALAMSVTTVAMTPSNLAAITNVNNGLLKLDASGLVPTARIPGSIDDVLEYANLAAFPGSGTTGKMYVAIDTGKVYRWSGSVYVEISASPGTTDAVPEGSTNLYYTQTRADARADARILALVGNTDVDLAAAYVTAKA